MINIYDYDGTVHVSDEEIYGLPDFIACELFTLIDEFHHLSIIVFSNIYQYNPLKFILMHWILYLFHDTPITPC